MAKIKIGRPWKELTKAEKKALKERAKKGIRRLL
jgi:hypothetical protein